VPKRSFEREYSVLEVQDTSMKPNADCRQLNLRWVVEAVPLQRGSDCGRLASHWFRVQVNVEPVKTEDNFYSWLCYCTAWVMLEKPLSLSVLQLLHL